MRIQPTSFYDPDEEERRWELEHMHRFAGASLDPSEFADEPAPQPEPDEERAYHNLHADEQRGYPNPAELEMDAMRAVRDSYGKEGNFWEDNTVPLIAGGVDLLLNKGRDLGAIVAGGGLAAATRDSQRKSAMRQLAQLQLSMGDAEAKRAHDERMFGLQEGNLAARNAEIDEARARRLALGKEETDLQRAQRDHLDAQTYRLYQGDDMTAAQRAADEDRDALRQDRREEREERRRDREEVRAGRLQQQQIINQRQEDTRNETATNKFLDKTEETRAQASQLRRVEPIVENPDYTKDLPGVGKLDSRMPSWLMHPFDSQKRQDADAIQRLAGEAGQYFKHEITGAASTDREQTLLLHLKGLEPGATEEQFRNAISFWKQDLQEKLRARASASPSNARRALEAQGLGDWALGPEDVDQFPARGSYGGLEPQLPPRRDVGPPDDRLPVGDEVRPENRGRAGVTRVNDYLRRLQDEDDDLGVGYR